MVTKCVKCGARIDTEMDECLTTPFGVLCETCANNSDTQEISAGNNDFPQTMFQGSDHQDIF